MPGTQELTRRIKSIKSTRKITRAMQMVSAAKMRKAQNATLASRSYADQAWELIYGLTGDNLPDTPLLKKHPHATKVGVVLITSNRGLVGGFNANLLNQLKQLREENAEILTELVVLGKKGREGGLRQRQNIIAEFPKYDSAVPIAEVYPIARFIADAYASGEYRQINLIYNKFVSTLVQQPAIKQLLPFTALGLDKKTGHADVLFEPSPQAVLNHLLPRIIESQLYQAILESDASEHSARMVMMKNATDAAGDLIDDLTLAYNQLRQNRITTELSEITAGKIALEK